MLSDESIHNTVLHRPNSHSNRAPFLVPVTRSENTQSSSQRPTGSRRLTAASQVTTITDLKDLKSVGTSNKSIRVLRPETLKRAIDDSCMAASIGDLEWLKQSLVITNDIHYDRNGFATIHLACIHGRLNIIKYLIEEQDYDVDLPSQHGWRPIHLCISMDIGKRALECLKYLIEKGADINLTNNDQLTPVHMAASEGHFDCLKILLEMKADLFAKDCRNHTPLDLATLWSHRQCAKLLNSYIWHVDKKAIDEQEALMKRVQTQEILKEIEKSHFTYYENSDESAKHFDKWLMNQGFLRDEEVEKQAEAAANPPSQAKTKKKDKGMVLSSFVSGKTLINNKKAEAAKAAEEAEKAESERKKKLEKRTPFVPMNHAKQWDYSVRPEGKEYTTNLDDFFPRDPYTLAPMNLDLVLLNKELKGMSLIEVKEFMNKPIKGVKQSPVISQEERPFYYKPKNIIDAQTKYKIAEVDEKRIDSAGMTLQNDTGLFQYKQAKRFVDKQVEARRTAKARSMYDIGEEAGSSYGSYFNTNDTLRMIKEQLGETKKMRARARDEKLDIVRGNYGDELKEFMTNKRHGVMDQKYEKVFIC